MVHASTARQIYGMEIARSLTRDRFVAGNLFACEMDLASARIPANIGELALLPKGVLGEPPAVLLLSKSCDAVPIKRLAIDPHLVEHRWERLRRTEEIGIQPNAGPVGDPRGLKGPG